MLHVVQHTGKDLYIKKAFFHYFSHCR